jgi:electron transport complex protein RnfG
MKLKDCENFLVLGLFLGMVGLLSALVLGLISNLTAPEIAKAELRTKSAALKQLKLPEFDNDPTQERCEFDGVDFMAVRKGGKLVGIAAEAETKEGYAGKIRELVGFLPDGTITSVLVTEENETPGLGKNVCERKFQKTIVNFMKAAPQGPPPNPILDQFSGRKAGDGTTWQLKKDGGDFDGKTGATVTSRAVTGMTGKAAETFAAHRSEIAEKFPEVAK